MDIDEVKELMDFYGNDNYHFEEDCRDDFYSEEGVNQKLNIKKISAYLKKLKENGDDYKIKHIRKLYRIYNLFYQIKSLIFSKDTFEYTDESLSTDDFYGFLIYVTDCIKADIIRFIDMIQDNDFDNKEILRDLDKNKKFNIYLKYKHFFDIK